MNRTNLRHTKLGLSTAEDNGFECQYYITQEPDNLV